MISFEQFFLEYIDTAYGVVRKSHTQGKHFSIGGKGNQTKKDGSLESASTVAKYNNKDVHIPMGPKAPIIAKKLYTKYATNTETPFESLKVGYSINLRDTGYKMDFTPNGWIVSKK